MPRIRKPQTSGVQRVWTGRVASTTTGSTTTQAVYRIPTGNRRNCDVRNFEVIGVSPIEVAIEWENIYRISLDPDALRGVIENYDNLDLSNTTVTLNTVDGPVTITGNLNVEDWTLTADEVSTALLTATNWNIATLTSTDFTATNITASDVSTWTLEASSDASVGWTLTVDGNTTLSSDLNVWGNESVTWNETVWGDLTVTGNIQWFDITATNSLNTVDLNATWNSTLDALTAWATTVDSLTVTNWATVGTTLWVTWNTTVWGNLSVAWTSDFTWASNFVGNVTTNNIESTGTATLNDVTVTGNETVNWNINVGWNATVSSTLTVVWASTLSSNVAVGGNLSVSGNSTVTGTSTTTGNAIFNSDVTIAWDESVAGNESITWTLTVGGDTTLADDLVVNGTTSLKALETDGSVDIDGTLRVTGAINGGNGMTITGQIESDTVRTWEVVTDEARVTNGIYLSENAEAPDFVLQSEKGQPNGVAPLDENGQIDTSFLPEVYTTAVVKLKTWIFNNSNTAIVTDADIQPGSAVFCTNYSDIIWDLDEIINPGQITVVSNQTETGSFMVVIIKPLS